MKPLMLDLFCGLGGASEAARAMGWEVHGVDVSPEVRPDEVADLASWSWGGRRPDLLWASPPCTEFAREDMPWCRTGVAPDLTLARAVVRIVEECRPAWWVVENVRGAIPLLSEVYGHRPMGRRPLFFWGRWPPGWDPPRVTVGKERMSSTWRRQRARTPVEIGRSLVEAVEAALPFAEVA